MNTHSLERHALTNVVAARDPANDTESADARQTKQETFYHVCDENISEDVTVTRLPLRTKTTIQLSSIGVGRKGD